MRDLNFHGFDFQTSPQGDLALIDGANALRQLIHRWIMTNPVSDPDDINPEEIEARTVYPTKADREADYLSPVDFYPDNSTNLTAAFPWDPNWGLGIKRFLNQPITKPFLQEMETRVITGLINLDGVEQVNEVTVSAIGNTMTIHWIVETQEGQIDDYTKIHSKDVITQGMY